MPGADDDAVLVEHGRLTGRDAVHRLVELEPEAAAVGSTSAGERRRAVAKLRVGPRRPARRAVPSAATDVRASDSRGPTTTVFVAGIAAQRIERLPVGDAEPPALARREPPVAVVASDLVPSSSTIRPSRAAARAARGSRGSRRRRGSTPPGSRAAAQRRARRAPPRRASRPSICSPSGNQMRSSCAGSSRASMYDWSFARVDGAREQQPAAVLDDARVVAGREPVGARAPREGEQLREAEAAVAARCTDSAFRRARSRRRTGRRPPGGTPPAGRASRAARRARGTSHALRSRPRASSRPARRPAPSGSSQSRSVTPTAFGPARRSATALSTPPLIATATRPGFGAAPEHRPDRVRERVDGERLSADGRSLEQRQPDERPVETVGVCLDDPLTVDGEAHEGPLAAAG